MITDIRLQNFRSYKDASFEIGQGVNIIVGPNTSGKTNLLEGVMMICSGGSYRAKDTDVIHRLKKWARVDVHTPSGMRTLKLEFGPTGTIKKSFIIDDQPFVKLVADKTIPIILFEPNQLQVWSGEPALRRDYIDSVLEKLHPTYKDTKNKFNRTLAQRNALLKNPNNTNQELFVWNIKFSQLAEEVYEARKALVAKINQKISTIYSELADKKFDLALEYKTLLSTTNYASSLLKKLEQNLDIDKNKGFTGYGPHREDLAINIGSKPANLFASRGEMRTILLTLKKIELALIEEVLGKKPIILFDDVFSELDGTRRKALTKILSNYQTFITTTDADVVVKHFSETTNIIPLSKN